LKFLENLRLLIDDKEEKDQSSILDIKPVTSATGTRCALKLKSSYAFSKPIHIQFGYIVKFEDETEQFWQFFSVVKKGTGVAVGFETWNDGESASAIVLYHPEFNLINCNGKEIPCTQKSSQSDTMYLINISANKNEIYAHNVGMPIFKLSGARSNIRFCAVFYNAQSELSTCWCELLKYKYVPAMNAKHDEITLNIDGSCSYTSIPHGRKL
jgi:hypothetical protein